MEEESIKTKRFAKLHRLKSRVAGSIKQLKGVRRIGEKNPVQNESNNYPLIDTKAKHRVLAALSYFHILVLIPLFFSRGNQFIRFHARQGLALLVLWVVALFLFYLPILGWITLFLCLVSLILGLINVAGGKRRVLPVLGKMI